MEKINTDKDAEANAVDKAAKTLFEYLGNVIYDPLKAKLDVDALPESFRELGEGVLFFGECIIETCTMAKALAKGDLHVDVPPADNELAAPLKSLHASLLHLTWQADEVAKGNYEQRVDFMGEFSLAFNQMIGQLKRQREFFITQIDEVIDQKVELENIAFKDPLTEVYNRAFGMQTLKEWLKEGAPFVIGFIDLDNLKHVNDLFGHSEGDRYILMVTDILRKFSPDAIICRIGGDEFMILTKEYSEEVAITRLDYLRSELINKANQPDVPYYTSLSYGIVSANPQEIRSAGDLLAIADEKMYAFKRKNKMERKS
jgi:diguanylate cyclase (GGDEF)-like protein